MKFLKIFVSLGALIALIIVLYSINKSEPPEQELPTEWHKAGDVLGFIENNLISEIEVSFNPGKKDWWEIRLKLPERKGGGEKVFNLNEAEYRKPELQETLKKRGLKPIGLEPPEVPPDVPTDNKFAQKPASKQLDIQKPSEARKPATKPVTKVATKPAPATKPALVPGDVSFNVDDKGNTWGHVEVTNNLAHKIKVRMTFVFYNPNQIILRVPRKELVELKAGETVTVNFCVQDEVARSDQAKLKRPSSCRVEAEVVQ